MLALAIVIPIREQATYVINSTDSSCYFGQNDSYVNQNQNRTPQKLDSILKIGYKYDINKFKNHNIVSNLLILIREMDSFRDSRNRLNKIIVQTGPAPEKNKRILNQIIMKEATNLVMDGNIYSITENSNNQLNTRVANTSDRYIVRAQLNSVTATRSQLGSQPNLNNSLSEHVGPLFQIFGLQLNTQEAVILSEKSKLFCQDFALQTHLQQQNKNQTIMQSSFRSMQTQTYYNLSEGDILTFIKALLRQYLEKRSLNRSDFQFLLPQQHHQVHQTINYIQQSNITEISSQKQNTFNRFLNDKEVILYCTPQFLQICLIDYQKRRKIVSLSNKEQVQKQITEKYNIKDLYNWTLKEIQKEPSDLTNIISYKNGILNIKLKTDSTFSISLEAKQLQIANSTPNQKNKKSEQYIEDYFRLKQSYIEERLRRAQQTISLRSKQAEAKITEKLRLVDREINRRVVQHLNSIRLQIKHAVDTTVIQQTARLRHLDSILERQIDSLNTKINQIYERVNKQNKKIIDFSSQVQFLLQNSLQSKFDKINFTIEAQTFRNELSFRKLEQELQYLRSKVRQIESNILIDSSIGVECNSKHESIKGKGKMEGELCSNQETFFLKDRSITK